MIALAALVHFAIQTEVASFAPPKPKGGGTLTLTYRPKVKGAKVVGPEPVYALLSVVAADWSNGRVVTKLDPQNDEWSGHITLPANAARFTVYFFSKANGDLNNSLSATVMNAEGKPARCAIASGLDEKYRESLRAELAAYPDNLYAYRFAWFAESAYDKAHYEKDVKADLDKVLPGTHTPDYLATVAYGQMALNDEPKARAALKELVEKFPENALVAIALGDYDYGAYSHQIKGEGPAEIEKIKCDLITKSPARKDLRQALRNVSWSGKLPLEIIRAGLEAWIKDEPTNPEPKDSLARAYHKANVNLPEASRLMDETLDLYLSGENRIWLDTFGQLDGLIFPEAFQEAAEIYLLNHEYTKALGAIRTAQTLDKSMKPELQFVEGKIWTALGNRARATAAYEEAYRRGSKEAEAPLADLYRVKRANDEGFADYLADLTGKSDATASGPPAPTFSVTSLDGTKLDLAALKGKVVVLNFWFIGCAPCRVEMPALNAIVKEYSKNPDVVFIGFASDEAKDLREFLTKTPFNYHIVPAAGAIAQKYGVGAFPGHFVIGRDGRISSESTGGSADIDKSLRIRINRAIAGSK